MTYEHFKHSVVHSDKILSEEYLSEELKKRYFMPPAIIALSILVLAFIAWNESVRHLDWV